MIESAVGSCTRPVLLAHRNWTRADFLRAVVTLTQDEQRELWEELKRCGLIREGRNYEGKL